MHTSTRNGTAMSFLLFLALLLPNQRVFADDPAPSLTSDLNLEAAEAYTQRTLMLRTEFLMIGTFRRSDSRLIGNQDLAHVFLDADEIVTKLFQNTNLAVEEINIEADFVRFKIQDQSSGKVFWTRSSALEHSPTPARNARSSSGSYALPGTNLSIEEFARWENIDTGTFVNITKGTKIFGQHDGTKVETGITKGPFSLSIFAAQIQDRVRTGVTGRINIQTKSGWNIQIMAQVTEDVTPDIDVTEGRYTARVSGYPGAVLALRIDRTWTASQLNTSAGVVFAWKAGESFNLEPAMTVYIGLGRKFKDSKGKEWGSIEVIGSANIVSGRTEWILGVRASFSF